MTRIIAGKLGGRRIDVPPGDGTRPTTDRVREALFSALQSGYGSFDGLRFLDLFAGSGAIGIEALSRGAASADLVEQDRGAAQIIRKNVADLGIGGAHVAMISVSRFLQRPPSTPYDILFVDPPYAFPANELHEILATLGGSAWSVPDSLIVVERAKRDRFEWPDGINGFKEKKYGETILWYGHCHD